MAQITMLYEMFFSAVFPLIIGAFKRFQFILLIFVATTLLFCFSLSSSQQQQQQQADALINPLITTCSAPNSTDTVRDLLVNIVH